MTPGRPPVTGTSPRRAEDHALLRGEAQFTADLDDERLAGAAHIAFVRSPFAAATIDQIDTSDAEAHPGVIAVLVANDLTGAATPDFATARAGIGQPLLARDEVRFVGECVAAVVATTAAIAADAAELVDAQYTPGDPVLDLDDAIAADAYAWSRHEAGDAIDPASPALRHLHCTTSTTWSPRQMPAAIEARSIAAAWDGDAVTVWAATQRPHGYRTTLSDVLELEADSIRVIAPATGGGFGGKVSRTAEEFVTVAAARIVGRPVRWHETRSEYFATATQGRGERVTHHLYGDAHGTIAAIDVELVKDGGAYPFVGVMLPALYSSPNAGGCYAIPAVRFRSVGVATNRPPTSAFRGAGRSPVVGGLERAIDQYAAEIGVDPVAVRQRNLVPPDAMPYPNRTGGTLDEADYPGDLERALAALGYDTLRAEQAKRRESEMTSVLGIGIASYNHMTGGAGGEAAHVAIGTDGRATIVTGSTTQGHGHATTWAQVASDVLGIAIDAIDVVEGDTDAIAEGQGAIGSRSAQAAGAAVHGAANQVADRGRRLAAHLLEAAEADIVVAADAGFAGLHVVGSPASRVSWAELAAAGLGTQDELSCGDHSADSAGTTFASGCHIAVVEVDLETGATTIVRYVAVDDAGPRINPMIVEGQIHGGIVSGAAQTLGEVMAYDDNGTPVTANFADYAIGSIDQFPMFELVDAATRSSSNPLGFKGIGESGTVGATPAVHNAIVDAVAHLGVSTIDLPCTSERVWRAITDARGS